MVHIRFFWSQFKIVFQHQGVTAKSNCVDRNKIYLNWISRKKVMHEQTLKAGWRKFFCLANFRTNCLCLKNCFNITIPPQKAAASLATRFLSIELIGKKWRTTNKQKYILVEYIKFLFEAVKNGGRNRIHYFFKK